MESTNTMISKVLAPISQSPPNDNLDEPDHISNKDIKIPLKDTLILSKTFRKKVLEWLVKICKYVLCLLCKCTENKSYHASENELINNKKSTELLTGNKNDLILDEKSAMAEMLIQQRNEVLNKMMDKIAAKKIADEKIAIVIKQRGEALTKMMDEQSANRKVRGELIDRMVVAKNFMAEVSLQEIYEIWIEITGEINANTTAMKEMNDRIVAERNAIEKAKVLQSVDELGDVKFNAVIDKLTKTNKIIMDLSDEMNESFLNELVVELINDIEVRREAERKSICERLEGQFTTDYSEGRG
ncbi:MAG: hypothetical protein KAG53_07820 [Endozoicomonadaceae bacterium]|nr:hypothetical protein [Endozoicomonadaceae bacterium]